MHNSFYSVAQCQLSSSTINNKGQFIFMFLENNRKPGHGKHTYNRSRCWNICELLQLLNRSSSERVSRPDAHPIDRGPLNVVFTFSLCLCLDSALWISIPVTALPAGLPGCVSTRPAFGFSWNCGLNFVSRTEPLFKLSSLSATVLSFTSRLLVSCSFLRTGKYIGRFVSAVRYGAGWSVPLKRKHYDKDLRQFLHDK